MITPANALKFSMWLAATHPQAFAAVLNRVTGVTSKSRGLGAVQGTYIPRPKSRLHPFARGRFGTLRVGNFGDDDLETVVVQPAAVDDVNSSFDSSLGTDPTLQDINFSADSLTTTPLDLSSAAASVDNSGGFWSSLGSGLASVGSGVASAVGAVAGAVVNPQTLAAAGNVAAAVLKNSGATQQAQLQQAVLQAQLQRTATGTGAATVRYAVNPATGQTQAYYYNPSTGQYQLTQPSTLFAGATISTYLPYILIGGGVLLVVALSRNS